MRLENRTLTDIIPYRRNPRKNDAAVAAVRESIRQCGYIAPIIVDEEGVVLAGHTRLKALKAEGVKSAQVAVVEGLTEEQKRKYRLLDNKTAELAEWDMELLSAELEGLDFGGFDFGFDDIVEEMEDPEAEEDGYEPELPKDPVSREGDVWALGSHRVLCGDSTDALALQQFLGDKTADLLLTDPPYNVDYSSKNEFLSTFDKMNRIQKDIANDTFSTADGFRAFLEQAFTAAAGVLKEGGAFYIWHASSQAVNVAEAIKETGWEIRQQLIWRKNMFVLGRQDYQWIHEPCYYGWTPGAAHYFIKDHGQTTVYSDAAELQPKKMLKADLVKALEDILAQQPPVTVIDEDKPQVNALHPTMKPLKLMGRLIRNSTRPGELVLDPFGGSGSTLMAAEQLGRICYTVELDPAYVDVIVDRWEQFTGRKAKLIRR